MKQILLCKSLDSIDEDLENLPSGLSDTYDQMYHKLQVRRPLDRELGRRALQWVMCAPHPLTTEELLSAVRINIHNEDIDLKHALQKDSLVLICENFLKVDSNDRWRYFHLSAREYFDAKPEFAHQAITHCVQVCFLSLIRTFGPLESISVPPSSKAKISPEEAQDPFHRINPFSRHIQSFWPMYASKITRKDKAFKQIMMFLGSPTKSSQAFVQCFRYVYAKLLTQGAMQSSSGRPLVSQVDPVTIPIFAAVYLELNEVVYQWCEDDFSSLLQRGEAGKDILQIAAETGQISICNALVSKGFSIDGYGEASYYAKIVTKAILHEDLDMLRFFVEAAAADGSLLRRRQQHGMALVEATLFRSMSIDLIRYLTETAHADVNVSLEGARHGSALSNAAWSGKMNVMKYLVEEANADVNLPLADGGYGSALACATCNSNVFGLEPIKYLVKAKADVNAQLQGGRYGSALATATRFGALDAVKYLVEVGKVDVNLPLQHGKYGSALAAASDYGFFGAYNSLDIVKYLVEKASANVHLVLQHGEYGSALAAAASARSKSNYETVKYLVETGKADVDLPLPYGKYRNAIAAAKASGDSDIIRYLQRMSKYPVEEGETDTNLVPPKRRDGRASAAAKRSGDRDIIRYLQHMREYPVEEGEANKNLALPKRRDGHAIAVAKRSGKHQHGVCKPKKSQGLYTGTHAAKRRSGLASTRT